jgi:PAS domain S-box-containing protein
MYEFLSQLLSTTGFPPRWHCGNWTDFHGWLYIVSDLGVWSAYTAIPAVLIYFVWRKSSVPFKGIFWLFGAFILACGLTHLLDAAMFWWPAYRLLGLVEFLTAIISWSTVMALVPIVPRALSMRSPEELEREVEARRSAERELQRVNQELERRILERTAELVASNASLHQERERFEITLSSIGDAVIATDVAGRVTFVNRVAQDLTGWKGREAVGKPLEQVFNIVNENTKRTVENPAQRALREGAIIGLANHTLLISRTGVERPIDDSAAPIRDQFGHVVGAVLVFRDVYERRQADNTNRLLADVSEVVVGSRHYQSVLRQVAEVTVPALGDMCFFDVLTPEDEIERVSWKHVDPALSHWGEQVRQFVPHRSATKHPIRTVLQTGEPLLVSAVTEEWLQAIAASPVHLEFLRGLGLSSLMMVPMQIGQRRLGVMTFAHSTSRRRYTAEALRLGVEIARRTSFTIENSKLLNQLRDADQKKNEFLALLAHELRNPLAPMRNAAEFLKLAGPPDPQLQAAREMIERQLAQMVRLVDDLLDISRITSGKFELRRDQLDVAQVLELALETSRPSIEAVHHVLHIELTSEPLRVVGDITRLAQVISNLLNNAAKYTPEGNGHIWLSVAKENEQAVIRVRDNGIGIAADMLPQVFEMFTQVDRSIGRSHGGLGIGLTLVRRLIEMHEGSVEARSDGLGKGSEFVVRLPLQPVPSAVRSAAVAAGEQTTPATSHRILVVDDNHDSADSLGILLRVMGNQVWCAYDGPSALQTAQEIRPAVVLLDIGLPGMDGYEVARRLRQIPNMRDALIVAQTGWGHDEDRQRTQAAGFDLHLVKPIQPAALVSLLASLPARKN